MLLGVLFYYTGADESAKRDTGEAACRCANRRNSRRFALVPNSGCASVTGK
jgi:hypothetical protein